MTENRKTPKLRFKGFTDAWEQRKLGDVGTTYTGLSGKAKEDFGHGNGKFITYMNVFSNSVASSEMTEPVEIDDRQNKVISGDVLFTTSSETPEEVGMSCVWLEKSENTYLNSFCFGYRASIVFEPYYLAYMFRSSSVRKKITFLAQGISRYNISKNKMMNIEIFVPTMSEQQQVGEYFRKLDHLITLHQRKLDRLKNIKKSMLDKMFPKDGEVVPEIRFKGFTDAWEQRKLGDIGTITTGSTPSTSIPDYYSDDGIIWVTPTDISENITFKSARKLSELGQQVGRVVPKNTILVTCIASIGKNTMLGNTGSFNQQINGLTPNENKYEPYFLLIESEIWSAQMRKSAAAGTMQIINRTEFSGLETWIPKLNEQKVIGTYFRNLDNLITLHQRKLDKLKNIKKSMLDNMFV